MQRYNEFSELIKTEDGKRRYATMYYPDFPIKDTDIYIISKRTDRLDNLATEHYGDPRYWVVIARANFLNNATIRVPIGKRLRIPTLSDDEIAQLFREKQF